MRYIQFKTITGSLYEIDNDAKTWTRLEEGKDKGPMPLRTVSGEYLTRSAVEVGEGVEFTCKPITPGATFRYIYTSDVVERIVSEESKNKA